MMNRRFFQTRRVPPLPSTMEIELSRRDIIRENDQSPRPRTMPNFRINRIRRPIVRKPAIAELPEAVSHNVEQTPCRFCHNLIFSTHYDQHMVNCPMNPERQQENIFQTPTVEIDGSQRQEEEPTIESIVMDEEPYIPIPEEPSQVQPFNFIPNNSLTYTSEDVPEDIPNFAESLASPISQPMRPEPQDIHALHPSSMFSSVLSGISEHIPDNTSPEDHPIFPSAMEDFSLPNTSNTQDEESNGQEQEQPNQPENEAERHPHGAFVVRTIETGPNGSTIVRMRVIPLDNLFGRQDENGGEGTEGREPGILGLLSMLAALQGVRATNFGDFLNLFHEERGLDKEVLESLPVVKYTEEGFKNVDEESKKCTICLDHYEDEQEVKFLWCMHRFHKNCVDQWLDKHTNCPFCKKDYSEALRNYE